MFTNNFSNTVSDLSQIDEKNYLSIRKETVINNRRLNLYAQETINKSIYPMSSMSESHDSFIDQSKDIFRFKYISEEEIKELDMSDEGIECPVCLIPIDAMTEHEVV